MNIALTGHSKGLDKALVDQYSDGIECKYQELKDSNKWKEIVFFKSDYIASKDVNAWLGLYEVIK